MRLRRGNNTEAGLECVAFVHSISYAENTREWYLVASCYSFMESFHPFYSAQQSVENINRKELILHFTDFDTMGELHDAEIIDGSKIIEARDPEFIPADEDVVQLVNQVPEGKADQMNIY